LILVGENGSGKTTFLRILFNFLSGRWLSLVQFRFTSITAIVDNITFSISREEIAKGIEKLDRRILRGLPIHSRKRITHFIETGQIDRIQSELDKYGIHFKLPSEMLFQQAELFPEGESAGATKQMEENISKL
jgi:predicted ATP-binding protein involved in virulence